MENSMVVPQKTKYRTICHMTHCWAYILTKLSLKNIHEPVMFIAALFTIAKTWKQPNVHQQKNG